MSDASTWWNRPRRVTVVVDNSSWIVPHAERLTAALSAAGDTAVFAHTHAEIEAGDVAFFLGCIHIASASTLSKHRRNLVVHESDLPKGRGFSPMTWQILDGINRIPVCLLEAVDGEADAGAVIYRDHLDFRGNELIDEIREALGHKTVHLCRRFLAEPSPPAGVLQTGAPTQYSRRRPADSQLDPARSIAEQFNLLRVVDNQRYPAWFEHRGRKYRLTIEIMNEKSDI